MIKQIKKERLSYIDFCANYIGEIGRNSIVNRFGIGDAAASKDLAEYMEMKPKNLTYDFKTKKHRPTKDFEPMFKFNHEQVFRALATGFGDTLQSEPIAHLKCENALKLNKPDTKVIAQVSRAIHLSKVIQITYFSLTSGFNERKLVPFAIVDSGLRWHVRAFDRKRNRFMDFVFTRIKSAEILDDETIKENESSKNDKAWNKIVTLRIVPHPDNIEHPEGIIMDYNMRDECIEIEQRDAVAQYLLRNWNVDCTNDHSLEGKHYQLWLANRDEVEGIHRYTIAPGIEKENEKLCRNKKDKI